MLPQRPAQSTGGWYGKVIGFAKIARDLTEERQRSSEQQNELESVQAANLQKDQFFAVLSHELKHPLNLIQLNTDTVARSQAVKNNPSLHKATQSIRTRCAAGRGSSTT